MSRKDLDLSSKMFRPDSGVPGMAEDDFSGALDLSDLLEQVEAGEAGERPPPSLTDAPSLLLGLNTGVHTSLISTSAPVDTAEGWQALAEEFAVESRASKDPELAAALMCEAGRVLVERLGRLQDGELLMRNSGAAIASTLLELRSSDSDNLATELSALDVRARDDHLDPDDRAAAWIELGLLYEENAANQVLALQAYDRALNLVPEHPVALGLAADAAVVLDKSERALAYLERLLEQSKNPRLRVSILLEMAELTPDAARRRELVERAHEEDPSEETSLRRLIRILFDEDEPKLLGDLLQQLADIAEDPVSASTALHLAFLTLADAGEATDHLVRQLAVPADKSREVPEHLAPLSEVALHLEEMISAGRTSPLSNDVAVLTKVAGSLDDPQEKALVREQMARLRMNSLRTQLDAAPSPADTVTGLPKLTEDRLELCRALEEDLRFCLVHLSDHRWPREALADLLEIQGEYRGLVAHLQEWARTHAAGPGRAEILLRLGHVHERLRHDLSRAAEVYELALAEDPDDSECLRSLGRVFEKMRRWPQAIANLQRQSRESSDGPARLAALRKVASIAQREIEDVDLAIATLEEIARMDADDLLSLYQLAALCRSEGRVPILVTTLQLLVERLDDDVARTSVLVELGEVLERQLKRREPAREAFERALKLTPGYAPALRALARIYRDGGDYDGLLRLYDPEVDSVTDPAVLALKAARVCLDEVGDIDRAIEYLRTSYTSNPDLHPARELLLHLLTTSGRIREAYDLLRAQDTPEGDVALADHHYRLGLLAEALGRDETDNARQLDDAALQHYRIALKAQPDHGLAFERSRRLLVAHNDVDNLIRLLESEARHLSGGPKAAVLTQLGRLHTGRVDGVDQARRAYEEASQIAPSDPIVRRELESLLRRIDDHQSLPAVYLQAARYSADTHLKATLLVEAAELLLASGKPEDRQLAGTAILEALRDDPGNPYAVRHLERLLSEPDPPLTATEAVSARAVRAQSDAERAIFYLESAELLEGAGEFTQARRAYQAALGALPGLMPADLGTQRLANMRDAPRLAAGGATSAEAQSLHNLMAEARDAAVRSGASGDPAEGARAITILAGILARDPSHRDAIALTRALTSQLPDPRPAVELLTEIFPRVTSPNLRYDLGLLLAEFAPRLEDAAAYLQKSTEADPEGKEALSRLVDCYRKLGRDREAAAVTERLLGLYEADDPAAIDLRMGIASFLANEAGTVDRAIEHARLVLEARPEEPRAIYLMADLLERSGERIQAADLLDRMAPRERDRDKLHDLYLRQAKLLAGARGDRPRALAAAENAVGLNPGHRETVALFAALLEQSGKLEAIADHLPNIRTAMTNKIARGALSLRDLKLLADVAEAANPSLSEMAASAMYALDPNSSPAPREHLRAIDSRGLSQILSQHEFHTQLYSPAEHHQIHDLLAAAEAIMPRLTGEFPSLNPDDLVPVPPGADPQSFATIGGQWARTLGLSSPIPQGGAAHNACVLLPGDPPVLRMGVNLWSQGDPNAWRGLAAIALSRHAWGAPLARSLAPIEMDLLLAACFEASKIFNAITADPDPRRLAELTAVLSKQLPRRQRRQVEKACQALSNTELVPSATAKATLASDLRLAALLTGDIAGMLSAACLLDGVAGGSLKQRINRSSSAQGLLVFVLSDEFLALRKRGLG